jgi:ATP-dependent Clp protease adaptor protein ClpS
MEKEDTSVIEKQKTTFVSVEPTMFRVVFVNDDVTPQQFVVEVLIEFFDHDPLSAEKIMLDVHKKGAGTAGIYAEDVAISKANMVIGAARDNGFPLKITVEKA